MNYQKAHIDIYEGPYDYLFISYAHADAERVLPIMKRLSEDGVRLWYDDGIEIGSSWDDNIAHHLKNAKGVVLFFSENYFKSSNCKDEANYARDLGKDQIIIQLEETQIPAGMEMRFNRIQSVSVTDDAELMYKKIYASSVLKHCRRIGTEAEQDQENAAAAPSANPLQKYWKIAAAAAALVVLGLIVFFVTRKPAEDSPAVSQPAAAESSLENAAPDAESAVSAAESAADSNPEESAAEEKSEESAVDSESGESTAEDTSEESAADGKPEESAAEDTSEEAAADSESAETAVEGESEESAADSESGGAITDAKYTLGDTIDVYKAGSDTVEYTIRVDEIHVMPEDFYSNMWEKFDPDQLELVSVKCTIENFGFSKGKENHLQLYMLNQEHTIMVKDKDDFMMRSVDALYHGSDGVYDVITTNAIPAGSKGRFALMFYVEKGTEYVTVSVDNHHGVIAKSDEIRLS